MALAAELGRPDGLWSEVVGYVEGAVREYEGVRSDRPRARFMGPLQNYRAGDPTEYAVLAADAARKAEAAERWPEARRFWRLEARWREMAQDSDSKRSATITSSGKCYAKPGRPACGRSIRIVISWSVWSTSLMRAAKCTWFSTNGGGPGFERRCNRFARTEDVLVEGGGRSGDV